MNTAIHRIHLNDLRSSEILRADWGVTVAAALTGAFILFPIAMYAFVPIGWVIAIGLVGAALGVFAAGLAHADEVEQPALARPWRS